MGPGPGGTGDAALPGPGDACAGAAGGGIVIASAPFAGAGAWGMPGTGAGVITGAPCVGGGSGASRIEPSPCFSGRRLRVALAVSGNVELRTRQCGAGDVRATGHAHTAAVLAGGRHEAHLADALLALAVGLGLGLLGRLALERAGLGGACDARDGVDHAEDGRIRVEDEGAGGGGLQREIVGEAARAESGRARTRMRASNACTSASDQSSSCLTTNARTSAQRESSVGRRTWRERAGTVSGGAPLGGR
jgi:hypothetical protein